MDLSARRQPPTVRLRRLAAELRGLRTDAGLTREEVSEQTNINSATLYRIETAKVRPQRRTLLALLDKYGVADETRRNELIDLSKQATQLGWLQAYESELPEEYTAYISFEAEARGVRNYESLFVPGLLQTEDYARAVIKGALPLASDDEVERRVEARMQRQATLTKDDPIRLWAILDEAVLHRAVGGAEVMAKQLHALVESARLPHITLQVIPFKAGAHAGMPGSFVVMDFPDAADPDLVYIDSMAGDLFLEREPDVRRYSVIFEHLRAVALDPASSVQLVEARMNAVDT
ncbi:helix-turn-helix protein [Micromonospora pisi]|uniref:Helix-turn-helix protein n=1 Tax=Micromonospora pisi TaxID=589240 RepID=A0A495JH73_9ACTN|nr:helix-turn-helix transcriptional regulator [Micromonospora pisi]RKR88121.1 helix-turn-helix protein [Micromonospora pisi]